MADKFFDKATIQKIITLRTEIQEVISAGLAEGLTIPGGFDDILGPILQSHGQGGNYNQDGGPYTQSGGGSHHQSGSGGYTQSAIKAP